MRHRRDLQTLAHVAAAIALYGAALAHSLWWTPLAVFVGMHTLAIEHNHAHSGVFRRRWMNRIFDQVLTLVCGIPQVFWKVHHLGSHHRHSWTERDWSSPFNYRGAEAPGKPAGYRYYQLTYYPLFFATSTEHILRGRDRRLIVSFLANLAVLAVATAVLAELFGVFRWLLVVGLSYAAAALMLGAANYMEHWSSYQRSGEFEAWTFTCRIHNLLTYNSGFHWLHHLRPTLHWSLLPGVHRADPSYCRPDLVENGLFPGYRRPAAFNRWLEGTARWAELGGSGARGEAR